MAQVHALLIILLIVIPIGSIPNIAERRLAGIFGVLDNKRVVDVLFAKTFTLKGSRMNNNFCSTRYSDPFYADAGQLVQGTVVSTQPINFYIVRDEKVSNGNQSSCLQYGPVLYGGAEYGGAAVQWIVPGSGRYLIIFMNVVYYDASIATYLTLNEIAPT